MGEEHGDGGEGAAHGVVSGGELTVVVSPTARQSAEFVKKAKDFLPALGMKPRGDGNNRTSLVLPNGSRMVGLPGTEGTIRGYSAAVAGGDRRSGAGER
jgi:hypothetical protein